MPQYFFGGTVFPIIKLNNGIITFRPIFGEADTLDFTKNIFLQFLSGHRGKITSKLQQAIYLKFGLQLSSKKPKRWAAVLQTNVPDVYYLSKGKLKINGNLVRRADAGLSQASNVLIKNIPGAELTLPEYFNGIHLGYDRNILKDIPKNLHVFDMSLNKRKGQHPTIEVYCDIRRKLVG